MWMWESENGLRSVFLMGVTMQGWLVHPWIWWLYTWSWCLHPWSWWCCLWSVHPLIMQSYHRVMHPWRWWCWGLVRFLPFSTFSKLWSANVGFWWMDCGGTVINWEGFSYHWNRSRSSVIVPNCASQATVGASIRSQESMFIPWRIISACVIVGWVR